MIYDVEWLETAKDDIRAILADDPDRRWEVARLIARINDRLSIAPYSQGESRPPHDVHILFELPLSVRYRIDRMPGTIVVLRVRSIEKPSRP